MVGDRLAMERELSVDEQRLLYETCRAANVDRHCWHLTPAIARGWEMLIHGRVSSALQDSGVSRTTADAIAAARLNLDPATIESRRRQWQQRADERAGVVLAACTQSRIPHNPHLQFSEHMQ
jgi:hypothetical protein